MSMSTMEAPGLSPGPGPALPKVTESLSDEIFAILNRVKQDTPNDLLYSSLPSRTDSPGGQPNKGSNLRSSSVVVRSSMPEFVNPTLQRSPSGRTSSVASSLQNSPAFRPTALTSAPPSIPPSHPSSILGLPATPSNRPLRSSISGIPSPTSGSTLSLAPPWATAAPNPPLFNSPSFKRTTESCPGYGDLWPTAQARGSPSTASRTSNSGGDKPTDLLQDVGMNSMRSRRVTTPGIVDAAVQMAAQAQPHMAPAAQPQVHASPPAHSRPPPRLQMSAPVQAASPPPEPQAEASLATDGSTTISASQPSFNNMLAPQASLDHLLPEELSKAAQEVPAAPPSSIPEPIGRLETMTIPEDAPLEAPAAGLPSTFTFNQGTPAASMYDSPPTSSAVASPASSASTANSPATPAQPPLLARSGSIRSRSLVTSILQSSPAKEQPGRQLKYSTSLSLRSQQEFLKQQKEEQEALEKKQKDKDKENDKDKDKDEVEGKDKAEPENKERDIKLIMPAGNGRSLSYSISMTVRADSSTVINLTAPTAPASPADPTVTPVALTSPPAPALHSAPLGPKVGRQLNRSLNSSLARVGSIVSRSGEPDSHGNQISLAAAHHGPPPAPSHYAAAVLNKAMGTSFGSRAPRVPEDREPIEAPPPSQHQQQHQQLQALHLQLQQKEAVPQLPPQPTSEQQYVYEQQLLQMKLQQIQMQQPTSQLQLADPDAQGVLSGDREDEEPPPPPSAFLLMWIEENNMRMSEKVANKARG